MKSILALQVEFAGEDVLSSVSVEPSKVNATFLMKTQAEVNSLD